MSSTIENLIEVVHRRPRVWSRDIDRLHEFLEHYGEDALRAALARGLTDGNFGHEYIVHYLGAPVQKRLPL